MKTQPLIKNLAIEQLLIAYDTDHAKHFLRTVFTIGAWLPIWLVISTKDCIFRNSIRTAAGWKKEANTAAFLLVAWMTALAAIVDKCII
jgi:hypothetical protein